MWPRYHFGSLCLGSIANARRLRSCGESVKETSAPGLGQEVGDLGSSRGSTALFGRS